MQPQALLWEDPLMVGSSPFDLLHVSFSTVELQHDSKPPFRAEHSMGSRVADCCGEEWSSVCPHQEFAFDSEDAMQIWIGACENTPLIDASQSIEAGAMEYADPSRLSVHIWLLISTSKPDADVVLRRARMFHGVCEVRCLIEISDESVDKSVFLVWNPGTPAI
jgi:hypothetical protein